MWKVLRRHQGEEYESVDPTKANFVEQERSRTENVRVATVRKDAVGINLRNVALHQAQPYPKPLDPMVLTAPYDRLVYSKLIRNMAHEKVEMRRMAMQFQLELYGLKGEHVVLSLAAGVLPALTNCLQDEDDLVRVQACMALEMVAQQQKGQEEILKDNYLQRFMQAVDDVSEDVQAEALRLLCCVHCAHNDFACTTELMKLNCIKKYVEKAKSPNDDVACLAFAAMGKVFDVKEAFVDVLDNDTMPVVTNALGTRKDALLLIEAAECAGKLAMNTAGKRAAVQCKSCNVLIPLMVHENAMVRTAASGAVVACTISEAGKLQAIDNDIVRTLITAVREEDERDVLVNEVKTLCNISEHPYARLQLHQIIPRLEDLAVLGAEHAALVQSVKKAIAMIRWIPGDPLETEK